MNKRTFRDIVVFISCHGIDIVLRSCHFNYFTYNTNDSRRNIVMLSLVKEKALGNPSMLLYCKIHVRAT